MIHAAQRGHRVRIAAIALAVSCLGAAAIAQTNAPAINAPPATSGGAARQGGPAPAAPATPPAGQAAPPAAPAAPATPPAGAAPATPPAAAAAGGPVRACPANAMEIQATTDCVCTTAATAAETDAPVWGVDIYTADSHICRAARHAGIIPERGGTVRVTLRGPQQSYGAAERNGVASQNYGAYERSFSVAASEAKSDVDLNQCPETFQNLRSRSGVLTCTCTTAQLAEGTVWGSDVYTDDSHICRAARHAGAVRESGGSVTLRTVPGRQSYSGSTRNGVQTQDYGPWEGAFAFDK